MELEEELRVVANNLKSLEVWNQSFSWREHNRLSPSGSRGEGQPEGEVLQGEHQEPDGEAEASRGQSWVCRQVGAETAEGGRNDSFLRAGDCLLENGCLFQVSCQLLNITTNLMILYDFIDYLLVRWTAFDYLRLRWIALRMSWWQSRRSSRPSTRSLSRPSLRCLDTRHNKSGHKTKFKMLRTII